MKTGEPIVIVPKNVYSRIIDVMSEIGAISRDQVNKSQGFKFRGIDDVYNALHPLMCKHGVFSVPTILERTRYEHKTQKGGTLFHTILKIEYRFYDPNGMYFSTIVEGEAMDSGDKSTSKAMAIAHKYALLQVFCIPTEGQMDPDKESHYVNSTTTQALPPQEPDYELPTFDDFDPATFSSDETPQVIKPATGGKITDAQAKRLFAIAKSKKWSTEELKDYLFKSHKLTSTKDISRSNYDDLCSVFERLDYKSAIERLQIGRA